MHRRALLPMLLAAVLTWGAEPPARKRVYVAPDDHTDYMWTADEETYRQAFLEMIDYYLERADRTASKPREHQSRWNCDGNFWMWTYEKNKTADQFQRFLSRIRSGHISVPLNTLVSCYGGVPAEAVLRGMYYPGRIERRFGIRFPLAVAMENQTLPYGLGALWAGAGARYSWRGICGCASRLLPVRFHRRPHEVYWWGAPDGSRILMKWNSLWNEAPNMQNKSIGGYAEAFHPSAALEFVETSTRFREAWPYRILGIFGQGWDHLKTRNDDVMKAAEHGTTGERHVIVSNEEDFFRDFEATYGQDLPWFSAAFGNEWDLYSASVPELSARVRRSVEKLRTAESLATLVSMRRPEFLEGREAARDLAFVNLGLYWEHNWTADGPISRLERANWGRRLAGQIESYVSGLEGDAAYALGTLIRKGGTHARFYVWNSLGWERTEPADIPYSGPEQIHVVDLATGRPVPSQVVTLDWRDYGKGRTYLRVLARNVPPAGYRVFEIRSGAAPPQPDEGPGARDGVLENAVLQVAVDNRGAIASMVEKNTGREFARGALNDFGEAKGVLAVENAGPVSVTLRADVKSPPARTTRITLYRELNRIDISNEITQNFDGVRSWSFHFNLDLPDVWHEEVGAIVRARLTTDGGHYSPVHSRLDWLTLNHFAGMSGADGAGVTLSSADLAFMKLGSSEVENGVSRLDTATPRISVLAGGQVDGAKLGIPAQGGDAYFLQRFSLCTQGKFDAAASMRFSLEHQNPLRAGMVTGGDAYPETEYSLLRISDPDVLLWALKPAEEGISRGVIARVWNLRNEARKAMLSFTPAVASAHRATHIETDAGPATVRAGGLELDLKPMQMATYRLVLQPSGPARE